jgi:hypothetical protein
VGADLDPGCGGGVEAGEEAEGGVVGVVGGGEELGEGEGVEGVGEDGGRGFSGQALGPGGGGEAVEELDPGGGVEGTEAADADQGAWWVVRKAQRPQPASVKVWALRSITAATVWVGTGWVSQRKRATRGSFQ